MATLKELAEYTGFSITTISRVLNNDPTMNVSDTTRSVILEAAGKLHYRTSRAASRSRAGRGRQLKIGLAEMLSPLEQLEDPYYMYLKNYSLQHFADAGCAVIPLIWDQSAYLPSSSEKLDGILAIGIFSDAQTNSLASLSSSVIFLDSAPDELRFDSVVLNFQLGVEQAVDYLIAHGHREIGFLGPCRKLDQKKRPAPEVRRNFLSSP